MCVKNQFSNNSIEKLRAEIGSGIYFVLTHSVWGFTSCFVRVRIFKKEKLRKRRINFYVLKCEGGLYL